jgi:hypothetical protein
MSKILIENYRGFDIEFDTNYEKFQCLVSDENTKESNSFSAVKKYIDEYKKTNQDFKPFWVEPHPNNMFVNNKLKIIGIRKDGRFVAENVDGKKEQILDYNLNNYMLVKSENESAANKLKELELEEEKQRLEIKKKRNEIISTFNITTLEDYKKSLQ